MTRLFSERSIVDHFNIARASVKRDVGNLHDIPEVASAVAEVLKELTLDVATLARSEATFASDLHPDGTKMTLRVPFVGDPESFVLEPASFGGHTGDIRADILRPNSWRDGVPGPALVLRETFSAPTDAAVKAWGKAVVDDIEALLGAVRAEADQQNRMLRELVRIAVTERQAVLAAHDKLGDLGTGI